MQQTNTLSSATNNDQSDNNLNNNGNPLGRLLSFLPSPIDLWQARTPTSLLLLPVVFVIYVLLQLPLHFNSKTENAPTIHSLSNTEWKGRQRQVDKLSTELNDVGKELSAVKGEHAQIKGMVGSLRRRLDKLKERRNAREELLRIQEREWIEREEEEIQLQQQHGVAREGPIRTVSTVKALAVATFAGKPNVDEAKKDD